MAFADFRNALNDTNEIEPTTTGRTSGRQSSRRVRFVLEGESLCLLPVTGSDSQWYKNVLKTPTIRRPPEQRIPRPGHAAHRCRQGR